MKRKLLLMSLFVIMFGFFSIQSVFAAEDIASGRYNDAVDWRVTAEGELIIGSAGETQYLDYDHIFDWQYHSSDIKTASFRGTVIGQDTSHMFSKLRKLESIDLRGLNTQNNTSMCGMFQSCYRLKSLDVSTLYTGNVKDMGSMFSGCGSLTNLDLSGFDTRNVTWMNGMFNNCSSLKSLDLSGFNTSRVTTMGAMFSGCSSLTSLVISGFDTRNVTTMYDMFSGCSSLTSLDLSSFDTSNVTNPENTTLVLYMLSECNSLKSINTPRLLNVDIELPFNMYDSGCKEHTLLPKKLTSSITLFSEPQHQWIEEIIKPATCKADGVKKVTCSKCGVTETKVIPKTSHSWDSGTVVKPAKYLSAGVKTYVCSICGVTKSQAIPAKNAWTVTPARVKLSGAKVSGKKLTVKWKKIARNTTGYQVSIKDKKTGKEKYYAVKQSKKATLKKTIKKLKKGRKYAVRVRAYNQIGDEIIYGPWSNVKSGKF